jgi:ferredoxin--NADP+ reductase
MFKIIDKVELNKNVDQIIVHAPRVAKNYKPGHFIILRTDDFAERIPLTVVEAKNGNCRIIYQKLGFSTNELAKLNIGDHINDFVGPLGRPAHIRDVKHIIAVAGGVGAAPLLPQLKAYHDNGVNIDLIIGAKDKEHLILVEEYRGICNNIYLTTDDGSAGIKGFVTDKLEELLQQDNTFDHSIAIGPLIMMKNVVLLNEKYGLNTDVSLNPIMIDGTGMCGNCRVSIDDKTYFACIDGPDFPGNDVNFDELIARQSYYNDEEHICNLDLVRK